MPSVFPRAGGLHKPVLYGIDHSSRATGHIDFVVDMPEVMFDRLLADVQRMSNLRRIHSLGEQAEHLDLARGQIASRRSGGRPTLGAAFARHRSRQGLVTDAIELLIDQRMHLEQSLLRTLLLLKQPSVAI